MAPYFRILWQRFQIASIFLNMTSVMASASLLLRMQSWAGYTDGSWDRPPPAPAAAATGAMPAALHHVGIPDIRTFSSSA